MKNLVYWGLRQLFGTIKGNRIIQLVEKYPELFEKDVHAVTLFHFALNDYFGDKADSAWKAIMDAGIFPALGVYGDLPKS